MIVVKTKSFDRVIAFEIGMILTLLLVNWFLNVQFASAHVPTEQTIEDDKVWDGLFKIEEEHLEKQKDLPKSVEKKELVMLSSKLPKRVIGGDAGDKVVNPIPTIGSTIKPMSLPFMGLLPSPVDTFVNQMPQFPGGMDALKQYVQEHLDLSHLDGLYLDKANVVVSFTVDTNGDLYDIQVVMSNLPHEMIFNPVKRMLKEMPYWVPGDDGYGPVKVHVKLPITVDFQ